MRSCAPIVVLFCIACGDQLFPCALDVDCQDGGNGGLCQPEGVCSFPDDSCDSGQRFGAHSGGLSNECVPPTNAEGTSVPESSTGPASSADDDDPTLDVSGRDTLQTSSSGTAPLDDTAGTTTATDDGSTTGAEVDPTLLLWFTFERDTDEGLANDGSLGGVAPCVLGSCPSTTEGPVGAGATFDGVDDCAAYPFVDELAAPEFTLALWMRRDASVPGYDGAFTKPVGASAYNTWRVSVQSAAKGNDILGIHVGLQDDTGVELTSVLEYGVWTHMVSTWSGNELGLWIDGVSMGTLPSDLWEVDDHPVYVGCDDDAPIGITHFLNGALDDVRMYSRVLDAAEIDELFALGAP